MLIESLYRFICAFFVGAMLSGGGSFAQVLSQNPLASPSTFGLQAIVIIIQIIIFLISNSFELVPSLVVFHVIFILSYFLIKLRASSFFLGKDFKNFIMIGLCINLFGGALYSFVQFLMLQSGKQFPSELWFGNFKFVDSMEVLICLVVGLAFYMSAFHFSKKMRLARLGQSFFLGVDAKSYRSQYQIYFLLFYCVGIITILFGVFSFVGLVFPHFLRSWKFFKFDLFKEVVIGGAISGLVMAILDQVCLFFPIHGSELSIGFITALLGPVLMIIVYTKSSINKVSLH